jgi:hypothetical protein
MNTRSLIAFGAGALAASSLAVLIASGPDHDDHTHKHQDEPAATDAMGGMSPDEMMAAYMAIGEPGPHHEAQMKFAGDWKARTSFVMDPADPEAREEGDATCLTVAALDGRFMKSEFKSDFMGIPFTGIAYAGYDNARKQHVSIWMDTMSTSITYMTGDYNTDGDLVMEGTAYNPAMGDYQMKMVYHWHDDNTWSQTFYDQMPDGSWFNSGEITYSRK